MPHLPVIQVADGDLGDAARAAALGYPRSGPHVIGLADHDRLVLIGQVPGVPDPQAAGDAERG
jgi:hypothetical protein